MRWQSPPEIPKKHLKGLKQVNFSHNLLNLNSRTRALQLLMSCIIKRVEISRRSVSASYTHNKINLASCSFAEKTICNVKSWT